VAAPSPNPAIRRAHERPCRYALAELARDPRPDMSNDTKRIRARLRSYERKLEQEKQEHGFYSDGSGRRYLVGPHYMLLGDDEGALEAFQWFEEEFPEDIGEPAHSLCWTLALHRAGNEIGAARKLRQTIFDNLYLVPRLLGTPIPELDMWHPSNHCELAYANYVPEDYLQLWTPEERAWAKRLYLSPGFRAARNRYIEICKALATTRPGPERNRLVDEMHDLEG